MVIEIKRGDIVLANLEPVTGSEQGGIRPCLIIQNDNGNRYSPVTITAAITSKIFDKEFTTNLFMSKEDSGLEKDSNVLLNQIRTIDKKRIIKKLGALDSFSMNKMDMALKISLGLN